MRGLSLVELMVAMAIGIFLLAGAVTVFGKTRDLYRTNDAAARLQETARYAMSTIEADLRMANYWGLMSRADLVENGPGLNLASFPDVDPAYTLPADLSASDRYFEEDLIDPPVRLNADGRIKQGSANHLVH